jgi:hypothetical protein
MNKKVLSKAPQRLSLDDALRNDEKIYIQNNSIRSNLHFVISMTDKSGRSSPLKIPPVRFPICISDLYPADVIRDSIDLRRLLSQENIKLVDPVEAQALLQSDEALEELQTFNVSVYSDSAPSNAVRDSIEKLSKAADENVGAAAADLKHKEAQEQVNHRIIGLIASFQSEEKTSKETLMELKRQRALLGEAELTYIIREAKNDKGIREWTESVLAELSASPETPF